MMDMNRFAEPEYQPSPELKKQLPPVVIYDLECVLCNFWVKRLLRIDRQGKIRFAHIGSEFVHEIQRQRPDLNPSDGVMLWEQEMVHQGMEAVLRIAKILGGKVRVLEVLRILPKEIREKLYNWIARNRYGWFGKRGLVCDLSLQKYSNRFLS